MNLVITGHFVFPHGSASASRVRHLARGLAANGQRVWVIPLLPLDACDPPQGLEWHEVEGVRYLPAAGWAKDARGRLRWRRRFSMAAALPRAVRRACSALDALIGLEDIHAVIGYTAWYLFGEAVLRHCRARGLTVVRDVNEGVFPATFPGGAANPLYWNQRLAFGRSVPRAQGVLAISRRIEQRFVSRGMPVLRVPALIDTTAPVAEARERSSAGPFEVTYLGACRWRDAPELMLAAIRALVEEGRDVRLTLVGSDGIGGESAGLRRRAQRDVLLRERVRFTGRVDDAAVKRYLQDSDALLLNRRSGPSGECAFPTRLPEYLMSGNPVVASDVGDLREYLQDGAHLVLVPPDSAAGLADGIRRLMMLPDRGQALGRRGRERCRNCFDCVHHGRRIVEFLEPLVAARRVV